MIENIGFKEISAVLRHEGDTGELYWKRRPKELSPSERQWKSWNTRFEGKVAFTHVQEGYRVGCVLGHRFLAHRVCWLLHYGEWPKFNIDHIDGDGLNNRLSNLRDVEQAVNTKNSRKRLDNRSGVTGVYWITSRQKWQASVNVNGKFRHLGFFDEIDVAAGVRQQAMIGLGFSERHGQ